MIRIVFVDDEVNILHAMQRAMRGMRNEWDMEFLSGAAAALASLAKTPADVVVTDMRMPGMDGWELLAEVKKLYPQTVRLVLSGHADATAIMRLIGTAHQYIAKPGETEALKTAIAQTQTLRRLVANDRLAFLAGGVGTLPSCPKAFQEILSCLQRPNATVAEAAGIIRRDAAMTANVLKLVNSAFFGARQTISGVDRAVAYLGLDTLATLVLGHSLFQSGGSNGPHRERLDELWRHSQQTAIIARAIALHEKFPRARAEEAFLAGMLHDVGRVVFATNSTPSTETGGGLSDDSPDQIEMHHAEVGAYLLGLWAFPSHIVEAVAFNHSPRQRAGTGLDLTALVHIADRLAHYQHGRSPDMGDFGIEPGLLDTLGISDHLPQWITALNAAENEQSSQ
jgi:HD-like signal output (HDOD) protein